MQPGEPEVFDTAALPLQYGKEDGFGQVMTIFAMEVHDAVLRLLELNPGRRR